MTISVILSMLKANNYYSPAVPTINSVDNPSVRFNELIARYNKSKKEGKKNLTREIKTELDKLNQELRI